MRTRLQESMQPWARPKQLEVDHFYMLLYYVILPKFNMEPEMMVCNKNLAFQGGYILNFRRVYQLYPVILYNLGELGFCCPI